MAEGGQFNRVLQVIVANMIRVTFDSNVWENLVAPNPKLTTIEAEVYEKVVRAIKCGEIEAFLSSGIFISEAIRRADRKAAIKAHSDSIKLKWEEEEIDGREVRRMLSFGGDATLHPGNHNILKERLLEALDRGIKIIHMPRMAGMFNNEIAEHIYNKKLTKEEQVNFLNRCDTVLARLRQLKAGNYQQEQIGYRYNIQSWFIGLGQAPESENSKIAVALAESADGDAVAAHIGINADYFCTNDRAKKAGRNSVFSPQNVAVLKAEFGFNKVTPVELLARLG